LDLSDLKDRLGESVREATRARWVHPVRLGSLERRENLAGLDLRERPDLREHRAREDLLAPRVCRYLHISGKILILHSIRY
jgi:hypothetical protein